MTPQSPSPIPTRSAARRDTRHRGRGHRRPARLRSTAAPSTANPTRSDRQTAPRLDNQQRYPTQPQWSRYTRWELTWAEIGIIGIVILGQLVVLAAIIELAF
jgi:hypothetical protein